MFGLKQICYNAGVFSFIMAIVIETNSKGFGFNL